MVLLRVNHTSLVQKRLRLGCHGQAILGLSPAINRRTSVPVDTLVLWQGVEVRLNFVAGVERRYLFRNVKNFLVELNFWRLTTTYWPVLEALGLITWRIYLLLYRYVPLCTVNSPECLFGLITDIEPSLSRVDPLFHPLNRRERNHLAWLRLKTHGYWIQVSCLFLYSLWRLLLLWL